MTPQLPTLADLSKHMENMELNNSDSYDSEEYSDEVDVEEMSPAVNNS